MSGDEQKPAAMSGDDQKAARMEGKDRREKIVELLLESESPISGGQLGKLMGVSRQVVVQDIALLRSQGHAIDTTHFGYTIGAGPCTRLLKVHHGIDRTAEELYTIVDMGGTVLDVTVNHRTYGKVTAELGIASRLDVERFITGITSGKSSLLSMVTSGYHFHRISADSEETLDAIEQALADRGFLAEVLPYEVGTI